MLNQLGKKLKEFRSERKETLANVAKALGIDRTYLSRLESAHRKPSARVLTQLLNYYNVSFGEIAQLMTLAGYPIVDIPENKNQLGTEQGKEVRMSMEENKNDSEKPSVQSPAPAGFNVKIPESLPVLYTDSIYVTATKYGLVMDIAQNMASTNNQVVVARVGFSREHAQALLKVLSQKIATVGLMQKKEKIVSDLKN